MVAMARNPRAHCSECKIVLEYPQTMCDACERAFLRKMREDNDKRDD